MTARTKRLSTLRARSVHLCAAAGLAALSVWALRPLPLPTLADDLPEPVPGAQVATPVALDVAAFNTPLWVAPPAPPPPAPPPPAPPPRAPLRLQLVAIAHCEHAGRALFYDPDADRLISFGEGETIAKSAVLEKITGTEVQIREGQSLRSMVLRDAGKGESR